MSKKKYFALNIFITSDDNDKRIVKQKVIGEPHKNDVTLIYGMWEKDARYAARIYSEKYP